MIKTQTASRKKRSRQEVPKNREECIAAALERFNTVFRAQECLIAPPNRAFRVGDRVHIGNLQNIQIAQIELDGKAFVVEYDGGNVGGIADPQTGRAYGVWWWHECDEEPPPGVATAFARREFRGMVLNTGLDSILDYYSSCGLVCNPAYQRDYVWTQEDRDRLFDSIFNRMDIGMFILVRNQGFRHSETGGEITYRNLLGELVTTSRRENYAVEIIDGQQRLTTIVRFMLGIGTYRGYTFQQLSWADRYHLRNAQVAVRMIEEKDVDPMELLDLFIGVNAGVPMDPQHVAKIIERRNQLKASEDANG